MTSAQVETIRAELRRLAGDAVALRAHFIEDFEPPDGEARDFCEACAQERAGELEVRREYNSDSDILRWCEGCGTLLDFRIGPEDAEEEVGHFEATPPTEPAHWAELLRATAEVPPEDWREPTDPRVEPSPLWARVEALLTHGN